MTANWIETGINSSAGIVRQNPLEAGGTPP